MTTMRICQLAERSGVPATTLRPLSNLSHLDAGADNGVEPHPGAGE